jgi:hypothetical protein
MLYCYWKFVVEYFLFRNWKKKLLTGLIKDLSSQKQLVLMLYWEFSILMKCRFMIYRVQRLTDCNAKISWILLWYVKFSLQKFWYISDFWALVVKVQNGLQQEKHMMLPLWDVKLTERGTSNWNTIVFVKYYHCDMEI